MQYLVFFISFFLLGQSFSYCQDDALILDAIAEHCGDHDDTHTDGGPCSSICACSCCLVTSLNLSVTILPEKFFEINSRRRFSTIQTNFESQFIPGLLQPPQIA